MVELPDTVALALARQLEQHPAVAVELEDATDPPDPRTRTAQQLSPMTVGPVATAGLVGDLAAGGEAG